MFYKDLYIDMKLFFHLFHRKRKEKQKYYFFDFTLPRIKTIGEISSG